MGHVISIATPTKKSGKSSTAVNLAASFAITEKKTLLIDCDPVQGAGYGISILNRRSGSSGFYAVMTDRSGITQAILPSTLDFLKILPAGADFSKADFLFGDTDGHFFKLRDIIQTIKDDFDVIVIDTPSGMLNLLKTVMMATDWVLVPINAAFKSPVALPVCLADMKMLFQMIISLQEQFQVFPRILGMFLNQCDPAEDISAKFSLPVLENISRHFLSTRIPFSRNVPEGFAIGKPVSFQDIAASITSAYIHLAHEMMDILHRLPKNNISNT